ncbi:MAG: hypothetical protein DRO09_00115 [Thermoprotei archaeon]|nr:MAG: hypothetical protein DRO09_00115 [Thermoprotei archaeon]
MVERRLRSLSRRLKKVEENALRVGSVVKVGNKKFVVKTSEGMREMRLGGKRILMLVLEEVE